MTLVYDRPKMNLVYDLPKMNQILTGLK